MLILALAASVAQMQATIEEAELIRLAKDAVRAEVLGTQPPKPGTRTAVKPVFVTIERSEKILGCRGELTSRTGSLEEEVILEARGASAHDPRYRPLSREDLKDFLVTVTVVSKTEPIANVGSLQPSEGLVLEAGTHKGIVLPWEGRDPRTRLSWAYKKAGVAEGSSATLYRLIATRRRG